MESNLKQVLSEFNALFSTVYKCSDQLENEIASIEANFIRRFLKGLCEQEPYCLDIWLNIVPTWFSMWLYDKLAFWQTSNNALEVSSQFWDSMDGYFFNNLKKALLFIKETNTSCSSKEQLNSTDFNDILTLIILKLKSEKDLRQSNYSQVISSFSLLKDEYYLETSQKMEDLLDYQAKKTEERTNDLIHSVEKKTFRNLALNRKEIENNINHHEKELETTYNTKIEDLNKKAAETSTAVLGVFVGVVMVFFGGFTILENVVSGMGKLSVYRIYFTMLLFGFILFNIVVLLFYLISRIAEKTVACQCPRNPSNKCSECTYCKRFKFICRFENTMPYVYWGNAAIVFGLLFVFVLKTFSRESTVTPELWPQTILVFVCTFVIFALFIKAQHVVLTWERKKPQK